MKRFICLVLGVIISAACSTAALAESGVKLGYLASECWSETQGSDGWYGMYSTTKTIGAYDYMSWGEWKNINKLCYAYSTDGERAATYIANDGLMKPNLGSSIARVWRAPMDGTVKLTSNGGVRKNESREIGCTIAAKIAKTDENDEDVKILWENNIAGTDNIGENYDITIDVKRGEKLYFEVKCADTDAYGECRWDPRIDYTRTAYFANSSGQVSSMADVKENDSLTALFYDNGAINQNSVVYLALYDESGMMIDYRNVRTEKEDKGEIKAEFSIAMDYGKGSYDGWRAQIFVLAADGNRCYSLIKEKPFGIN